ncbi:MAG: helicase-related protein, partial [Gammaproteobacteria bacterium]
VDIRHVASTPSRDALIPELLRCLRGVLADDPAQSGDILVFLPGQAEIARVSAEIGTLPPGTELLALHGGLGLAEQQRAIDPAAPGRRKLVLATNIAETSLTIEGVGTVVDAGLSREPHYDPGSALTRLRTLRISRASSEQRVGRAGRLRPGTCHRLCSAGEQATLAAAREPEILQSDLAPLALALLSWGVSDPAELAWLDPPPAGAWAQAIALLREAGAIETGAGSTWRLTPLGERMSALPMHPRLARMLLGASGAAALETACALAALLAERAPPLRGADVAALLAMLAKEAPCPPAHRGWADRTRRQAALYRQSLGSSGKGHAAPAIRAELAGELLALAYPDRIAR